MAIGALLAPALVLTGWLCSAVAAELIYAKDGSGTYGYKDTPKLPWCQWLVHDPDRPAPRRIDPGPAQPPAPAPADAVALFNGKDLSQWRDNKWSVADGEIVAGEGELISKANFGDCQIHLEWMAPAHFEGPWYNRGNNGVMLMGLYEIQIFDSYNERIYPDGQAGAIYGQTPPRVNVTRPPGQWQTYDIVFTAPRFDGDKLVQPARVTLFHNGVLVQLNEEIHGETGHRIIPEYKQKISQGPLAFGGHGCPVRFRDIWVRPLERATPPPQPLHSALEPQKPGPGGQEFKGLGDRFQAELAVYEFLFSRHVGMSKARYAAVAMEDTKPVERQALVAHFARANIPILPILHENVQVRQVHTRNLVENASDGSACRLSAKVVSLHADQASAEGTWIAPGTGAEVWKFEIRKIEGRWKITKSKVVGRS